MQLKYIFTGIFRFETGATYIMLTAIDVFAGIFNSFGRAMRLTAYTDYALRTLMHLGINRDRLVTIQDSPICTHLQESSDEVAHQLGLSGMVETVRGRNGAQAEQGTGGYNIGEVVRKTETIFHANASTGKRPVRLSAFCELKEVLRSLQRLSGCARWRYAR